MSFQLKSLLQQAIQSFQSGNLERANSILNRVLKLDSKNLHALHILGLIKASQGHFSEAVALLGKAARINPSDASIQYNLAKALSDSGNDKDAITHHKKAANLAPNNPEAWLNFGKAAFNSGHYEDALLCYNSALNLKADYVEALINKGATFKELKQYDEAIDLAEQALVINPNLAVAWSNKGVALKELKRFDEAIIQYDTALVLTPYSYEVWTNKGAVLHELKRYEEAMAHYDKALSINPAYRLAWSNKGAALDKLELYDELISHCEMALTANQDDHEAWAHKGEALHKLRRVDEAIEHYAKAITLKPDYHSALTNKGYALHDLKRFDEAIAHYDKTLALEPEYHQALTNRAATLQELKRYDEAIANYEKALHLKIDIDWGYGDLLHLRMKICSLSNTQDALKKIYAALMLDEKIISPFMLLALSDNHFLQKKCSNIFSQNKFPPNSSLGPILKHPKKEKIRIAYFSPDFRNHPVSLLTAELFEIHDRDKFEVFGFSLRNAPAGDLINARLRKGFDKFIDVESLPDFEVAKLARQLEIDIAIDLAGPTGDSRTRIFSYRAAPIQVNWLGYAGTIGAEYIDYILADKTVIPEQYRQFYDEKVVYLPDSYMVDDTKRIASSRKFTKQECDLPEDAFVFCCFNADYKFNSQVLDIWSRILLQVGRSVLWISENNVFFKANIKLQFESRGIDASRIIFAPRLELMEDHLARFLLADLFLDTYPYNAHTTAIDSLKTSVPVITMFGQSFASRVAASLLNTIGLPELVTKTPGEYEMLAIELANSPQKFSSIKNKLSNNRFTTPLFDTPRFAKNIEAAYIKMYERYQSNLEPDHIS